METLSVMKPRAVRSELLSPRIAAIASAGVFSNGGAQLKELESRAADWLGVPSHLVVATSNATTALSAAVALSPAKNWHVPGWSFPATVQAPLLMNREVRLVDIDPCNWLVLDERESGETGLVNVIPFGGSLDAHSWSYPGELIIDAAASLASRPTGLNRLTSSQVVVFSLHATKALAGAEGGLAVFGSTERAKQARSWINFGFAGSREATGLGTNGKMSEYDAAVVNARLDGWREEEAEWSRIREMALKASAQIGLQRNPSSMDAIGPYWVALFKSPRQRELAASRFRKAGIETRLWWGTGLHKMPAFAGLERSDLRNIDEIANRYLGLPFFLGMSEFVLAKITAILADLP